MPEIKLVPLWEVDEKLIMELMNDELVGKQLPLLNRPFTLENCVEFVSNKKKLWDEYGFGPWAFFIGEEFAGWGGIQPENGEADFALILHPKFWGWGLKVFNIIKKQAFGEMRRSSITILFPPSRSNWKAVTRLGFTIENEVFLEGNVFVKLRLANPETVTDSVQLQPPWKS